MDKKFVVEEMLELVKNMNNEEREKFLNEMFYEYFNPKNLPRNEIDWN